MANVAISGSHFVMNIAQNNPLDNGGRKALEKAFENVAYSAMHDNSDDLENPKCHPGTRTAIIRRFVSRAQNFAANCLLLWLVGPAGAGKSAIMRSLAEKLEDSGIHFATFFFYNADADPYQFSSSIPDYKPLLAQPLLDDRRITHRSMATQFKKLITSPLSQLARSSNSLTTCPVVILIDGLEECKFLQIARDALPLLPGARFIFASRPEQDVQTQFDEFEAREFEKVELLSDLAACRVKRIRVTHPACTVLKDDWPQENHVCDLVEKSSGHLIYPATAIKWKPNGGYIESDLVEALLGLDMGDVELALLDVRFLIQVNTHPERAALLSFIQTTISDRYATEHARSQDEGKFPCYLSGMFPACEDNTYSDLVACDGYDPNIEHLFYHDERFRDICRKHDDLLVYHKKQLDGRLHMDLNAMPWPPSLTQNLIALRILPGNLWRGRIPLDIKISQIDAASKTIFLSPEMLLRGSFSPPFLWYFSQFCFSKKDAGVWFVDDNLMVPLRNGVSKICCKKLSQEFVPDGTGKAQAQSAWVSAACSLVIRQMYYPICQASLPLQVFAVPRTSVILIQYLSSLSSSSAIWTFPVLNALINQILSPKDDPTPWYFERSSEDGSIYAAKYQPSSEIEDAISSIITMADSPYNAFSWGARLIKALEAVHEFCLLSNEARAVVFIDLYDGKW
ncbi:hypothetical protein CPB83DRAFT_836243 [Crepidotus variabilis]|uniref:NACHT domain-containing protein n=1 Tax=Crepidotus variabilis TaxID=179855 RepID=A0A9P6EF49_9AGAR|nr:hypothetical protein CPB83DRAFT_836243 [Crepidotus variabilis]